jgi:hypothetical protein
MNTKLKLLVLCIVVLVAAGVGANSVGAQANVFTAQLSGGEEVPPVETMARGQAIFRLSPDGSTLKGRYLMERLFREKR